MQIIVKGINGPLICQRKNARYWREVKRNLKKQEIFRKKRPASKAFQKSDQKQKIRTASLY